MCLYFSFFLSRVLARAYSLVIVVNTNLRHIFNTTILFISINSQLFTQRPYNCLCTFQCHTLTSSIYLQFTLIHCSICQHKFPFQLHTSILRYSFLTLNFFFRFSSVRDCFTVIFLYFAYRSSAFGLHNFLKIEDNLCKCLRTTFYERKNTRKWNKHYTQSNSTLHKHRSYYVINCF